MKHGLYSKDNDLRRRYPTLWEMAEKHVHGYEYESLERVID